MALMNTLSRPSAPSASQSRREFLLQSGAALSAVAASALSPALAGAAETQPVFQNRLQRVVAKPAAKSLVGCNVYVWTQYAGREKKKLDLDEVLSILRDAGYDYLENFMDSGNPESITKYADQCRAKSLVPVSLYTGARLHDDKASQTVERLVKAGRVCKDAGFQVISCNPDPIGRAKTDAELQNQAAALKDLGQGLNDLGLRLGIHHHLPEMQDKGREFHYVFRNTPPNLVGFCYDVHWVWKGGIQPLDALREYGNRVVTWHLRQSRNGVWTEALESGDVDYEAVARYAKEHQLPRRFTVELALEGGTQITRSPAEDHRLSREFVRKVFGA